jgi:hypothetical protein
MNHLPVTHNFKTRMESVFNKLGVDPSDPKYSFMNMNWMAAGFSFHEDYAQNFLHTILIFVCLALYFSRKSLYVRPPDIYLLFIISLITTAFLFTVALKWQPWGNRLETPLFMLACVFLGIELGRARRFIQTIVVAVFIIYGFVTLALSARHPILPITKSIFNKPYNEFIFEKEQLALKKYLDAKPYTRIGIYIGMDSWDYPYYKLLSRNGKIKRTLKHLYVDNISKMYYDDFVPEAIITLQTTVDKYTWADKVYYNTGIYNQVALFEVRP